MLQFHSSKSFTLGSFGSKSCISACGEIFESESKENISLYRIQRNGESCSVFWKFKFILGDIFHQLRVIFITDPRPHQSLNLVHTDGNVGVADHPYQLVNSSGEEKGL